MAINWRISMYFVFRVYFLLNIDNLASEHLKTARAGPKHVLSNKLHITRKFNFKVVFQDLNLSGVDYRPVGWKSRRHNDII